MIVPMLGFTVGIILALTGAGGAILARPNMPRLGDDENIGIDAGASPASAKTGDGNTQCTMHNDPGTPIDIRHVCSQVATSMPLTLTSVIVSTIPTAQMPDECSPGLTTWVM